MVNDCHVHFFSPSFLDALGAQKGLPADGRAHAVAHALKWEEPASIEALANRWTAELTRHGVARAALIASVPGDEESVAAALAQHPSRFVGFFMLDPTKADAVERATAALDRGLRGICLFPAMHHYPLYGEHVLRIFDLAKARPGTAVFAHCGALSVGVRKRLGLPSPFEMRYGNPLDLQQAAHTHPTVPIILPHFGAGLFREALMLAEQCPNVHFDTSSSNSWLRYQPGLTIDQVFKTSLDILGPDRLLFGTDSSFFPRGWVREIYDRQRAALGSAAATGAIREKVLGGNFDRLFPQARPQAAG
jgi:predicted TIM-barrel fold metal-dependent hydrolase